MKQFISFTKKELRESIATYRLYILLAVFVIVGIMGPLIAMITPALFESLSGEDFIVIYMPEPTAVDSWTQFFSGFSQMAIPALAIIFSGIMANEFSRGTLLNLLTKGLNRGTVIMAKFFSASILWTVSFVICIAVCYVYTALLWDMDAINYIILVFGAPWLFGLLMISLLIFGGTLSGSFYGSLFSCFGAIGVMFAIGFVPGVPRFNPLSLTSGTLSIIRGTGTPSDFIPAAIICAIATITLLAGSIALFNKKKL